MFDRATGQDVFGIVSYGVNVAQRAQPKCVREREREHVGEHVTEVHLSVQTLGV